MKPDPFDDLLDDYARQLLPPTPSDFTANVRYEIGRRRNRSFWTRVVPLLDWHEFFSEPRLAVSALVCAFAIGVLPALALAKSHADQQRARQSIHFNVFSTKATAQVTALLPE